MYKGIVTNPGARICPFTDAPSPTMPRSILISALAICASLTPALANASSFQWVTPTLSELAMTSDPKAPGASAVVLSYEQADDNTSGERLVHVRIKVLNEAGLSAGTIDVSAILDEGRFKKNFFARTIHPDGTILSFVSDTTNTHVDTVQKTRTGRTAALPGVTVDSILEYGYHLPSENYSFIYYPVWRVQRQFFVHAAHFTLKLQPDSVDSTRWFARLPDGVPIIRNKNMLGLDITDVPAVPDEELTPPPISYIYSVRFFNWGPPTNTFWGNAAATHSAYWSSFYGDKKHLADIAQQLAPPTGTEEARLRKIYDAVQQLENTDLTRVRSEREDKRSGFRQVKTAEDIWNRKRGDSEELTLLFVALARGAGFHAYPMAVASRDETRFSLEVLDWWQMDSMVAIVTLDGHDRFFDPGTRRCPFGSLAPWHASSSGVSTDGKEAKFSPTPAMPAKASRIDRVADLSIDAADNLTGTLKISWFGVAGLGLRRRAVFEDEQSVRSSFEHDLQADLPEGVEVKLQSFDGLADPNSVLVAKLAVSGRLGTATAKRLIVPSQFFALTAKPIFAARSRTFPIAFPVASTTRDEMTLHLAPDLSVETLPSSVSVKLGDSDNANYSVHIYPLTPDKHELVTQRVAVLNHIDYVPSGYASLQGFYAKVAEHDRDQIVLQTAPPSDRPSP